MTAAPSAAILRLDSDEFINERLDIRPGQHVSLLGPTGVGKTTMVMAILPAVLDQNPASRAVVLAAKPHRRGRGIGRRPTGDPTLDRWARTAGARVIRTWPAHRLYRRQRLFVLWPQHHFDDDDEMRHSIIFDQALHDCYREGDWIIVADEVHSLCTELGLDKPLIRLWSKGRSMGDTVIAGTQRPAHVPLWMYSQASHLFLWRDPDRRARERYGEISGFDRRTIESALSGLGLHDCLYLRSVDQTMCIISGQ